MAKILSICSSCHFHFPWLLLSRERYTHNLFFFLFLYFYSFMYVIKFKPSLIYSSILHICQRRNFSPANFIRRLHNSRWRNRRLSLSCNSGQEAAYYMAYANPKDIRKFAATLIDTSPRLLPDSLSPRTVCTTSVPVFSVAGVFSMQGFTRELVKITQKSGWSEDLVKNLGVDVDQAEPNTFWLKFNSNLSSKN